MEGSGGLGSTDRDWVAVILSAGASSRFEGQPKALLPVGRELAIARIARLCGEAGADRILAVLGPHHTEIEKSLEGIPVETLENPDWSEGRTGSVQVGLRAVDGASEVLLWPVDHPFVAELTLERLKSAAARDTLALWFLPTFRGGGGHPVLIRRPALDRILELPADAPLRSLLPDLGPQVRRVVVEDPGILENVDSFDAYWSALEAWKGREGATNGP
jgi:molybdenum cofactor cytidylyltransferase